MAQEVPKVVLAIDVALAALKAVRAGNGSTAAFCESLKALNDDQLVLFSDLSRMRLDMVKLFRSQLSIPGVKV